ncbi:hypothetical protein C9374_014003 [Naegleria lovaniensis]|uniref:Uncharacterized protein n=1 Tax=Naegleria lovaniensis TaxID=51637 RepID=A0AA88H1U4_NAELO|nr:uncharacterized protein C9374_014003 [Naegleria lovaniensis]KAG2389443.1 hypothetical protein C9374_014003 [Naegleria lovaniensis]
MHQRNITLAAHAATTKTSNNKIQTASAQPLSYQQKKKLKLAVFRSKFRHPLGYESKTASVREEPYTESHPRPLNSSSKTRASIRSSCQNHSSLPRPSSLPPIVKHKLSSPTHQRPPTSEKRRAVSAKQQRKEWDSRFALSESQGTSTQTCSVQSLSRREKRDIDRLFAQQQMAYLKASNIIASLENPELKLEPKHSPLEYNKLLDNSIDDCFDEEIIDWYDFDIERLTSQFMHIPDFPTAKWYLRKLWDELAIPLKYQGEFEIDHFQSDSITNRTFLFSEITTIESFRDRLRVALIWLHGKSHYEIEENANTWTTIVETFREDYQYLYKTSCFLFNNRDLFLLVQNSMQNTSTDMPMTNNVHTCPSIHDGKPPLTTDLKPLALHSNPSTNANDRRQSV